LKAAEKPVRDKSKPISSTPIQGTAWCVVWTGDRRVFFFKPSTKESLWECPKELKGKPEVARLTQKCPVSDSEDDEDEPEDYRNKKSQENNDQSQDDDSEDSEDQEENDFKRKFPAVSTNGNDSTKFTGNNNNDDDSELETKRFKLEKEANNKPVPEEIKLDEEPEVEMTPIEKMKATLSKEERIAMFKVMLSEKEVSFALVTFDLY